MIGFFNLWQLVLKGGAMVWPLLLLSIVLGWIGLEKVFSLIKIEKEFKNHKNQLLDSIKLGSIKNSIEFCESMNSHFSRMLKSGLLYAGNSKELISAAMDEIFVQESLRLKDKMSLIGFMINTAVLIGLLGTIISLTVVFYSVQIRSNMLNPLGVGDVALGIWQALITTILGLMVAIFGYAIHSYCAVRINNLIADLDIAKSQALFLIIQVFQTNISKSDET